MYFMKLKHLWRLNIIISQTWATQPKFQLFLFSCGTSLSCNLIAVRNAWLPPAQEKKPQWSVFSRLASRANVGRVLSNETNSAAFPDLWHHSVSQSLQPTEAEWSQPIAFWGRRGSVNRCPVSLQRKVKLACHSDVRIQIFKRSRSMCPVAPSPPLPVTPVCLPLYGDSPASQNYSSGPHRYSIFSLSDRVTSC